MNFEYLLTAQGLTSLFILALLEIVLGIDNIIFISIIAGKVPPEKQGFTRTVGLALALVVRIGLLFGITWLIGLTATVIDVNEILQTIGINKELGEGAKLSWKDIILLLGGIFLVYKSTTEIHDKMELTEEEETPKVGSNAVAAAIFQIILVDIVFSFDSILTAVGIVKEVSVMIMAVIISMIVMMLFAGKISDFINNNPTFKMLALSFLILIGFLLVLESLDVHVEKTYVYVAMAFACGVEVLNMRTRKGTQKHRNVIPMGESVPVPFMKDEEEKK
ncbi:membrane protein TerC, possibly involved in tellurium resistance [Bernardetia litoralis DSM 6794]|uniref:Membrane protein TerC, possibly involved in tellurium resistance n=1 Tax=Bernardetia litoralis (strain ATCC 23117 / DSM 6794 / NBRC 15988 / NCIMB 1366 / Fx l1 / Sio-4) TaxID=880071 RepID=I4APQ5_BERLS|nr:TerC family protein [Bernardetia litoralis]AFM05940.1 membrane protein TerC, possibly involved in tellurium resistance [Bernardetia litoralis DSM 6794]